MRVHNAEDRRRCALGGTLKRSFRLKRRHRDHVHPMGGCQHIPFPALGIKARPKPKLRDRKSLNFQGAIGRTQEIQVEEVETVETVGLLEDDGDSAAVVSLPS
jgi:hypothetical protein